MRLNCLSECLHISEFYVADDDGYLRPYTCGFDSITKQYRFCCQGLSDDDEAVAAQQVCMPFAEICSELRDTVVMNDKINHVKNSTTCWNCAFVLLGC